VASLLAALLVSLAASSDVRAVSPQAEALVREGRSLMAAGDLAAACVRFARSYALDASSGALLNLALCHEREGKLATALAEYRAAARLAREQHREDRALVADERVGALEPQLAHVTIVATQPVPGLLVAVDGSPPGEVRSEAPLPIEPGLRQVHVTAAGYQPWSTTVEVKAGERRTVAIPVLAQVAPPAPPPPAVLAESQTPVLVRPASDPPAAARPPSSRLDLYLAVGGAALVASGAVSWGIAYEKFQSAKTACNEGPGCLDYDARVSSIRTFQGIAIGTWIAGGAALLVSGLHYVLRDSRTTRQEIAISAWANQLDIRVTF
jgi:tetratricopeptide (TPR) repeat protein